MEIFRIHNKKYIMIKIWWKFPIVLADSQFGPYKITALTEAIDNKKYIMIKH